MIYEYRLEEIKIKAPSSENLNKLPAEIFYYFALLLRPALKSTVNHLGKSLYTPNVLDGLVTACLAVDVRHILPLVSSI